MRNSRYIIAALSIVVINAGVTATMMNIHQVNAQSKGKSAPAWVDHPDASKLVQPTVLTKHELFSEDHVADVVAIQSVWAAYTFYNDSDNGEGMASLFTPDAVDQHVWDYNGKLQPHYGIVAEGDTTNDTPLGQRGSGCVLRGRAEISAYFGVHRRPQPLGWPGHGHHETPSILVKVSDDGQTAVMSAPYVIAGVNDKGEGHVATGGYRAFFKKTAEGWEVAELYAIDDHPHVTTQCDVNGPLPRIAKQ